VQLAPIGEEVPLPERQGPPAHQEGDEAEGARVRPLRAPDEPTTEELEEHLVTHFPRRAWCRHCCAGRGKSDPHQRQEDERRQAIPTISIDYCFPRASDIKKLQY